MLPGNISHTILLPSNFLHTNLLPSNFSYTVLLPGNFPLLSALALPHEPVEHHSPLEKFSWPRILSPISVCLLSQKPQNLGFRNATKSRAATRPIRTFALSIFSSDAIFSHQQRAENETEDAVRTSVERQCVWHYLNCN